SAARVPGCVVTETFTRPARYRLIRYIFIPPPAPAGTSAAGAARPGPGRPTAAPTHTRRAARGLRPAPPPASESGPAPGAWRTPTGRCRRSRAVSTACADGWRTGTDARCAGQAPAGRAPARTGPRTPGACRSPPPPGKSASPAPAQTSAPLRHRQQPRQGLVLEARAHLDAPAVAQHQRQRAPRRPAHRRGQLDFNHPVPAPRPRAPVIQRRYRHPRPRRELPPRQTARFKLFRRCRRRTAALTSAPPALHPPTPTPLQSSRKRGFARRIPCTVLLLNATERAI